MVGTIEHASESCGVYSCKYLIRSTRVGITSTLSIGDGDIGQYLSIESVTAYWRGTGSPNPKVDSIFFKTSEHTVRGMAGYAGKSISMVGIFLHDCKEPDMVGLLDGSSHEVS